MVEQKIGHHCEKLSNQLMNSILFSVKSHYPAEAMPRDRFGPILEEELPAAEDPLVSMDLGCVPGSEHFGALVAIAGSDMRLAVAGGRGHGS